MLQNYSDIFQNPKGLPPQRVYDHKIPIKEGSHPVNARPYRYAAEQKAVIEQMIIKMLEAGIIQRSHSPYANPVVLVKKKGNT